MNIDLFYDGIIHKRGTADIIICHIIAKQRIRAEDDIDSK